MVIRKRHSQTRRKETHYVACAEANVAPTSAKAIIVGFMLKGVSEDFVGCW